MKASFRAKPSLTTDMIIKKVLCFGEILMRFSPLREGQSFEKQSMPFFVGGAELNVANALSKWKVPVVYCTAMPDNFFTNSITKYIASNDIDTSAIYKTGNRIGVYYLAQGTDVKNAGVVFDRENSSFANLQVGMIDWHKVLKNVSWFHLSAIAVALTDNTTAVCIEALEVAKSLGITISIDLNYRNSLWKYGKKAYDIMPNILKYCDVVMGNLWSVESLLNIPSPIKSSAYKSQEELLTAAQKSIHLLQTDYPNVKKVAYTFRLEDYYWAVLQDNDEVFISKKREINNTVDKVGSGDCFMAGLIYGMQKEFSPQQVIDYAASAAVGKLYEKGDCTNQTVERILARI